MKIYTIGHSTRNYGEFVEILKHYNINLVVDVRKFPRSKKFPHFCKENLEKELSQDKIQYINFPQLGGFRKEDYLVFSQSNEFVDYIKELKEKVNGRNSAIFCAEILWWRCHRKYIAKILSKEGYRVIHIFEKNKIQEHISAEKEIKEKMNFKIFCDKKRKIFRYNEI